MYPSLIIVILGPCSLGAIGARLLQSSALLGVVEGLRREETVGVTPGNNTTGLRLGSHCVGFGGSVVLKFLHIVRFPVIRCVPCAGLQSG